MYLSRIEIDFSNPRTKRDLTHFGAVHGWVEHCFPAEIAQGVRLRHLWRIDRTQEHDYLLLLSPDKPDLQVLSRYGLPETAQVTDYDDVLNAIQNGQVRHFRLTANAVKRRSQTGQAVAYTDQIDLQRWLLYRAVDHGFEITTNVHGDFDLWAEIQRQPLRRGSHMVPLSLTTYEGQLRITDAELFKQTLTKGIGREKAFGCGLLTIAPISEIQDQPTI